MFSSNNYSSNERVGITKKIVNAMKYLSLNGSIGNNHSLNNFRYNNSRNKSKATSNSVSLNKVQVSSVNSNRASGSSSSSSSSYDSKSNISHIALSQGRNSAHKSFSRRKIISNPITSSSPTNKIQSLENRSSLDEDSSDYNSLDSSPNNSCESDRFENKTNSSNEKIVVKVLCCDKCDGKHETDDCPHYKKKRELHPDAQKSSKHLGGASSLPGGLLKSARVVRQPGDGSCLFHSISYGLHDGSSANTLRNEICQFIIKNPNFKISDTPLSDWVKWDSGSNCRDYASRMSRGAWGGGIEMSVAAHIKGVNLHVYEQCRVGYKRISAFDHPTSPENRPIVRVLYCGGVHYGKCLCIVI